MCAAALAAMVFVATCNAGDTADLDHIGRPVDAAQFSGPEARMKVDLPGAKDNVKLVRLQDGTIGYVVKRLGSGTDRLLTPQEFAEFVRHRGQADAASNDRASRTPSKLFALK